MAGLMQRLRDNRRQRRADRRQRRAQRLESRASSNRRRALDVAPAAERATLTTMDPVTGQPVTGEITLQKRESALRNARIAELEGELDELRETVLELQRQLGELESEQAEMDEARERQEQTTLMMLRPVLAILDGVVGAINAGDTVYNRLALQAAEGLDSYLDYSRGEGDALSDPQRATGRLVQLLLKMYAFYDGRRIDSIFGYGEVDPSGE